MNKIVFINKNKGPFYRFFWHIMFKTYINTRIRKKYLSIDEYGDAGFRKLRLWLFNHINSKAFTQKDFLEFKEDGNE